MDLRIQRTRKNIINAFLELRAKKPLEKISIKELSEKAEINKATFYLHYRDIYNLSEVLENELIENIISSIEHPDAVISDPQLSVKELTTAFISHKTLIDIIFSDERKSVLIDRIEVKFKELIFSRYPEYNNCVADILLTYSIKGGYYAFLDNMEYDKDELISVIGDIAKCITERIVKKSD